MDTNHTHRKCPVCDTDNAGQTALAYSQAPWEIKECVSCGCVYLENPPTYEALEEDFAWEKTSAKEEERRKEKRPAAKAVSTAWKQFRQKVLKRDKLMDLVRVHIPTGSVLDIGCGGGGTLARLPGEGHIPYGIEISKALAAESNQLAEAGGGKVIQASALEGAKQFPEKQFDGVMMSAFLEHEVQPGPLLNELHRILKPGGCIIIKVPNYGCVNRSVRGGEWCGFRFPDHVNYFTPQSLTQLAKQTGYKIARFRFQDKMPTSDNMWAVIKKPA